MTRVELGTLTMFLTLVPHPCVGSITISEIDGTFSVTQSILPLTTVEQQAVLTVKIIWIK